MNDWAQHQSRDADQRESTVESVKGGEQFAASRFDWIDRTHAAENHRSVEHGIDPRQAFEVMVAAYADGERAQDNGAANRAPSRQPPDKEPARKQCLVVMFKFDHAEIRDPHLRLGRKEEFCRELGAHERIE